MGPICEGFGAFVESTKLSHSGCFGQECFSDLAPTICHGEDELLIFQLASVILTLRKNSP